MTTRELLAGMLVAAPALTAALLSVVPSAAVRALASAAAPVTGALALVVATVALADAGHAQVGSWIVVDAAGGLIIAVTGLAGTASVLASCSYLESLHKSIVPAARRDRVYFVMLYCFWAILLAVPLAGNLGAAWILVEATTATSAVLVGFSGKPRALEAGWKYLILTTLGLGVALLGLVILAAGVPGGDLGALSWSALHTFASGRQSALVAYLLLLAGLATKIGWAPVHNWLPDAHSEAPPPVSALLSGALLPAVLLVAWRSEQALGPAVGLSTAHGVVVAFGLASIAVAVPFLWRTLAWKRLLAYSSLEHMGVLALGIGFASPLALAGVAIHVLAHGIAKALGFYAATPLLAHDPRAAGHAVTGIARSRPALGTAMGISLGTLAGLPPSPLFLSEVLIVAGGFEAGRPWTAAAAAVLLALAFLGLAHALLETTAGKARNRDTDPLPGGRLTTLFAGISVALLAALASAAFWLPDTSLVTALAKGIG